jgi:hypothetical protein
MTNLLFTFASKNEDELPCFRVQFLPGEDAKASEYATALLISTASRMLIEQVVLCCGGSEPYQFVDDAETNRLKKRFEKLGVKITIDRNKLLKAIKPKKK